MTATPQAENTAPQLSVPEGQEGLASPDQQDLVREIEQESEISEAVSYTHLTLPTIYSV